MARTISQIRQQATAVFVNEMAAAGYVVNPLTWSSVNLFRLIINVYATCAYVQEVLFDKQSAEMLDKLNQLKVPSRQWYKNVILNFQFGFPLIAETDKFDNTGYTAAEIEASKVIKHVAIIKQVNPYGRVKLRFKIAGGDSDGNYEQIDEDVVTALTSYLDTVAAAAGDNYEVEGRPSDKMKNKWRIYYDPLILNAQGGRLDGTASQPVRDAIKSFLKDGIKFESGTYVVVKHIDWVQAVPGVVIPELLECSANYGATEYVPITTIYNPDGGWIEFANENDLEIEFVAYNAI
ncbi:MAG TPA: hypothetical protein PKC39_14490 [Ferruginibacter sp.]|nr:hypothetical protein [Ferruginibacter sp.]HMP22164.1 hypothetical protein [Ferruginibacter sp.]